MIFIISAIKRPYIPISKKDNILKNNNLIIPENIVILSVTLALPIPCIKEANILSK